MIKFWQIYGSALHIVQDARAALVLTGKLSMFI